MQGVLQILKLVYFKLGIFPSFVGPHNSLIWLFVSV